MKTVFEVNFDGLVGPTHNYSGLSFGNIASMAHHGIVSNPKMAAQQGLRKMKRLMDLGIRQAVLPPHERPDIHALRRLGFHGQDHEVLEKSAREAPDLLAACASASSMWAANAATVSPSSDTHDGRVHLTPANLNAAFHRALEHETTGRVLQSIFPNQERFAHHPALPANASLTDEGAANHTRLCRHYGGTGINLFVYGRHSFGSETQRPALFPARQTQEASAANARIHQLDPDRVMLAQQGPEAIDAGVFHNDVIAVGNQNVFFYHELAFLDTDRVIKQLEQNFSRFKLGNFCGIKVPATEVSIEEAIRTYLFNSQLVTPPSGGMILMAPEETQKSPPVAQYLDGIVSSPDNPIQKVLHIDLRESMRNGGGPACLRLRIVLTEEEIRETNPSIFLDEPLYGVLTRWVDQHFRDRLSPDDLADPSLLSESREALDALTQILNLGSIYPFQLN